MISLEKSVSTWQFPVNKVIKFGPCWEAPYLWLVTYWQWHYRISSENGGQITKTPALIAGAPFPFPSFVLFSLPLPLPFLHLPRRLYVSILKPQSLHVMFFLPAELAKEARKEVLSHWMESRYILGYQFSHSWCEAVFFLAVQCNSFSYYPALLQFKKMLC